MSARHSAWVTRLLNGESGEQILKEVHIVYTTDCSLRANTSKLRRLLLERCSPENAHPSYEPSIEALRKLVAGSKLGAPCRKKIVEFLGEPRFRQHALLKKHAQRKLILESPEANAVLKKMKILPENASVVQITSEIHQRCEEQAVQTRLRRNEEMLLVENGDAMHRKMIQMIQGCNKLTLSQLILALCSVSGRRFTEMSSQNSKFAPCDHEYGAMFTGQLKRHNGKEYQIPLLVKYTLFANAVKYLRSMQGDVALLSNRELSVRYQGNASREMKTLFPFLERPHDLRACYAAMVHQSFDWGRATFNRVTMQVLGHASLAQSLAYNTVKLKRFTAELGKFPLA